MSNYADAPRRTGQQVANNRPLSGFRFGSAPAAARAEYEATAWLPRKAARRSIGASVIELGTTLSGVGLAFFVLMHLGLLSTVLIGAQSMNSLASFLERYYLLQVTAPFLILLLVAHVVLTGRRAPTTFREQLTLLRQLGRTWHADTWIWAFQLLTAGIILALATIHLWVVLTDIPIKVEKSAGRINGAYFWLYIPFILAVEAHISAGLYRVLVKWGIMRRLPAHVALSAWTVLVLGLGFTVLLTLRGLEGVR